jgi:CDP-diacylglycerol--glycerol-3-phosphate 3-phosphatidyltransferase
MNLPNKLTMLRILLIPVFLLFLLGQVLGPYSRYAALAVFLAAAATDALDGYLARKRGLVTDFGKFADPLADKLLVCSALIAMTELGWLPAWVVILIVAREFMLTGFRAAAAAKGLVLAAGFWGKLKTVAQMALIVYSMLELPGALWAGLRLGLTGLAVCLTLVSGVEYVYKNFSVIQEM